MEETDTMLTPAQVAARMQVSEATVLRLLRASRLRGVKFGKQWRIPADALQEYLLKRGDPMPDSGDLALSRPANHDIEPHQGEG